MKKTWFVTVVLCGGLLGCGKAPEPPKADAQPPAPPSAQPVQSAQPAKPAQPSTMQTVVDGFTGRAAVQQGKAASEKIKAINAKEQADIEDVMK